MFVIKMWAFLCPGNSAASKERELVERQHDCVFAEPMSEVLGGLGAGQPVLDSLLELVCGW